MGVIELRKPRSVLEGKRDLMPCREIAFSQCCLEGRHILLTEGSMGVFTSEKIKLVWLGGLIKLISVQPYN